MDPIGARSEENVQTSAGYKGTLTVTGGTTLEGLLSQIGITPRADGTMNVYINGVYVSKWYIKNTDPNRSPYSPYSTMKDIKVHDGDDITIVWQAVGSATAKPTTAALSACMLLTEEWWALSRFTQQDEMTVEAG